MQLHLRACAFKPTFPSWKSTTIYASQKLLTYRRVELDKYRPLLLARSCSTDFYLLNLYPPDIFTFVRHYAWFSLLRFYSYTTSFPTFCYDFRSWINLLQKVIQTLHSDSRFKFKFQAYTFDCLFARTTWLYIHFTTCQIYCYFHYF